MRNRNLLMLFTALLLAAAPAAGKGKTAKAKPVVVEGESCEQNMNCSWPAANISGKAEIKASSVLENSKEYAAARVLDNNPDTAWCEGRPGTGKGESLRITFKNPQAVSAVLVSAGYDKNPDLFAKNSRIKKATLVLSDRTRYELRFSEHFIDMQSGKASYKPLKTRHEQPNSPQLFILAGEGKPAKKVSWMMLIIDEPVQGWKYQDTCMSTFDVIPEKKDDF